MHPSNAQKNSQEEEVGLGLAEQLTSLPPIELGILRDAGLVRLETLDSLETVLGRKIPSSMDAVVNELAVGG